MCTVLVVEDEVPIRRLLMSLLRAEGLDAVEASNGQEALDLVETGLRPTVVLLDMKMPVLDGEGFLVRARQKGISAPTILVSAHADAAADRLKVEDHLAKPFDPDELIDKLERILNCPCGTQVRNRTASHESGGHPPASHPRQHDN